MKTLGRTYYKRFHKECAVEGCREMVVSSGVNEKAPLRHFPSVTTKGTTATISRGLLWGDYCFYHTHVKGLGKTEPIKENPNDWKQRFQQAFEELPNRRE